MNLFKRWKQKNTDPDIEKIEELLQKSFVPVAPSQEFVVNLRANLLQQFPQEVGDIVATQRNNLQTGLVVTGGILGGLLIIMSGVRGIVSLFGIILLLVNWFRQNFQQSPTTT